MKRHDISISLLGYDMITTQHRTRYTPSAEHKDQSQLTSGSVRRQATDSPASATQASPAIKQQLTECSGETGKRLSNETMMITRSIGSRKLTNRPA